MKPEEDKEKINIEDNYDQSDDIVVEELSGEQSLKKLRDRLKKCVEEKQSYLDGWQRSKADFINYRKGEEDRKLLTSRFANESFIESLLPVLDSFTHAKEGGSFDEGMERIFQQMMSILKKNGVQIIDPENEDFNPNYHEAVEMVPGEDGKVVEVLQKGYSLNEKIIRPARVRVGRQ